MASHLIDSQVYKESWSTEEMRQVWADTAMIGRWLEVEIALAEAEAELGVIPDQAASEIRKKARVELLDFDYISAEFARTGHSIMPILRNVQRLCDDGWGEYIHYGATTQDITDTGMMLGIKASYAIILRDLSGIEETLMELAERHISTVMPGRTHGQHALPATFGFKAAVWLREVSRNISRFAQSRERVLVGNLCGGVGTYSGFGSLGMEIDRRVMNKLGLGTADIAWHTSRDRLAEFACLMAMVGCTLGKIGNEVYELQKTEIAELKEPFVMGQVGSSTMPHKRNPEIAEAVHGLSKLVRYRAAMMLESLVGEHERDGAAWKPEWVTIPEACLYLSAVLSKSALILNGLEVDKQRMRSNLDMLKGLIMSEAAMFVLGQRLGKQTAHTAVYEASISSHSEGISFRDSLLKHSAIRGKVTAEELDDMLRPEKYVGLAEPIVERAVEQTRRERAERPKELW